MQKNASVHNYAGWIACHIMNVGEDLAV